MGGIFIDVRIGVIRSGRLGHDEPIWCHKPRKIIDMAVCMIVHKPIAQPHNPLKSEEPRKLSLYRVALHARIAIGVQQALLCRHSQPAPVAIHRSAFEDHG